MRPDTMRPGELLGTVERLQVQREALKQGTAPHRWYEPDALVEVPALRVDDDGAVGLPADGEPIVDVHNQRHPRCRDARGSRGLSVMAVADYEHLRAGHGDHLVDGIAGESITLSGGPALRGRDLSAGLLVRTAGGDVPLRAVRPAAPCVEFTGFVMRRERGAPVDDALQEVLATLRDGARGFVGAARGSGVIALGDEVYLAGA